MWRNKFTMPLVLEPKRSTYLLIYLLCVHGFTAAVLLLPLSVPGGWLAGLALLVLTSLGWQLRRHGFWGSPRLYRLVWQQDGSWSVQEAGQVEKGLQLLPDSFMSAYLIILRLRTAGSVTRSFILLKDSLPEPEWHLLRVRLRYSAIAKEADSVRT